MWHLVLALLALVATPGAAGAQPTPAEDAAADWIRPEAVPAEADALLRRLEAARPDAETEANVERIRGALPELEEDLGAALERANDAIERAASPADLEDSGRELSAIAGPLAGWKAALAAEAQRVADSLELIAEGTRVWSATRDRPETSTAGRVVQRRVEDSLERLNDAEARLHAWRTRVLAASDRVIGRIASVDATREKLQAAAIRDRASLLVPDSAPLWSRDLGARLRVELPRVPREVRAYGQGTWAYVARDPRPLLVQILLAVILIFVVGRFASHAQAHLDAEAAASRTGRLLERPYAVGLLLAFLASPLLHPMAPRRFLQLLATVALFPVARIVIHATEHRLRGLFAGIFALMLLDRAGAAVSSLSTLAHLIFLLSMAIGMAIALGLAHRSRVEGSASWPGRLLSLAAAGLAMALLADIGGWTDLATLVGRGILAAAIAALYLYAAVITATALLAYGLHTRTAQRSRLIARHASLLRRRAESLLRLLAVGMWFYLLATSLGLRDSAARGLAALLDTGVSVGALSLTVGSVAGFTLTIVVALLAARLVPLLLEEEVYPRTQLPRGVPYALTTLVRYGLYSLGLLFALAAAGVQLGQLSIMIGGLGIGIGLGLQDLVKNFAAGLTLLIERRVQVGDVLEMPGQGIFGRVLSIGMRASVVRTWTGAEVVVPNADLISTSVTNWTLSDRLCRIEVPVGVAYGSDPERVLTLLLDAVRSNAHLLAEPAPQALFKGFGESSLDFVVRAWIDQGYERALALTSELCLAVHRSLADAGVAIPFPQRDIHLATVSQAARAALAAVEDEQERTGGQER